MSSNGECGFNWRYRRRHDVDLVGISAEGTPFVVDVNPVSSGTRRESFDYDIDFTCRVKYMLADELLNFSTILKRIQTN